MGIPRLGHETWLIALLPLSLTFIHSHSLFQVRICVSSISDMPRKYNAATWLALRDRRGKAQGQVG